MIQTAEQDLPYEILFMSKNEHLLHHLFFLLNPYKIGIRRL